jgi:hypothetical protein
MPEKISDIRSTTSSSLRCAAVDAHLVERVLIELRGLGSEVLDRATLGVLDLDEPAQVLQSLTGARAGVFCDEEREARTDGAVGALRAHDAAATRLDTERQIPVLHLEAVPMGRHEDQLGVGCAHELPGEPNAGDVVEAGVVANVDPHEGFPSVERMCFCPTVVHRRAYVHRPFPNQTGYRHGP